LAQTEKRFLGMKVLYPVEGDGGGAVSHVLNLAHALREENIEPLIIFITQGPSIELARNRRLDFRVAPCKFFPDVELIWNLSRWIKEESIDVVHTHTVRGNFYGRSALFLTGCKALSLCTVHSFLIDELRGVTRIGLKEKLLLKREVWGRKLVDHFVSVSEALGNKMLQDGIPKDKLTIIKNGIPLPDIGSLSSNGSRFRSEFKIRHDETLVGIVGRLVPVKNHGLFLKAAKKILKVLPNIKFLIAGDGYLRSALQRMASDMNIKGSVIFAGWRNDIDACFNAIDILVLCSTTESQGLVILEAMAHSKAVVATDVAQVGETVLHGETGLLVPPDDAEALANSVLELIHNRRLTKKLGKQGQSFVQKEYGLEIMVAKTAKLYKRLQSSNRGQRSEKIFGD
jgi:glycosyltransferase involved in cell wall biosynthesis